MTTSSFDPPSGYAAFSALIDELLGAQRTYGVVLQRHGLTLDALERLCLRWITASPAQVPSGRSFGARVDAVLTLVGARPAHDDAAFETVAITRGAQPPRPLPFAEPEERPSTPRGPSLSDAPVLTDAEMDALWGGTLAADSRRASLPPTPFEKKHVELSLETCARIAALRVVDDEAATATLEALEADLATFLAADAAHRRDAIERLGRGDEKRSETYDRIYVTTLEEKRGPITEEDYARLVVATERGTLDEVLKELGIDGARFGHIERDRLVQMAAAPEVFMRTMQKVRAARRA